MINRRALIKNIAVSGIALGTGVSLPVYADQTKDKKSAPLKGNIKHSVCRWTYSFLSLDDLCKEVKKIGFHAIDLVGPKEWPTLKKYDIFSSMCNGAEISIPFGWNDKQYHEKLVSSYTEHIDLVAAAGYKNLICFSGNKNKMDDETGLVNCVEGLKKIMAHAEKKGVVIQMELLNSKVDHKDYMCDNHKWGVELCKRLGSENFKLLYDIYHMQIDEGDVIRTIQDHHQYFGHYHTGGVPGRHEINDSQELFYPAIMRAILATGFQDYVAQEFIPIATDKVSSLNEAIHICDI